MIRIRSSNIGWIMLAVIASAMMAFAAVCSSCNGSGRSSTSCMSCKGTGRTNSMQCMSCGGSGWLKCQFCNGSGHR